MANPVFPATLENCPIMGWREGALPNIITFESEVGAQKRRRRSTNSGYEYIFQLKLSHAQLQTFWDWYEDTVKDGVLKFDMIHPRTKVVQTMQFGEPPEVNQVAPQLYLLSMNLRAFV